MAAMLDIKLEALGFDPDASGMKDTYVALRIGESQKLSRLTHKRDFKFPQHVVGDRKFGRVDVFKRIGSATISVKRDPATESEEINMPLNEGSSMKFRVCLSDNAGQAKPPKQEINSAVLEASSYLIEHNLEMRLSEAMQAVLRERPTDPTRFIADKLKENEGVHQKKSPGPQPAKELKASGPDDKSKLQISKEPTPGSTRSAAEELRAELKSTLAVAVENGQLQNVLKEHFPQTDVEELRSVPQPNVEELRCSLRKGLIEAAENGQLKEALLRDVPKVWSEEDMRDKLKKALSEAADSGQLQKVLSEQPENVEKTATT